MLTIIFKLKTYNGGSYITKNVLLIIRQVELIEKKEFVTAALDSKHKAFVIHIATLSINSDDKMHPLKKAQIAHLKIDKISTKVFSKYTDFVDVFSPKLAAKLSIYTRINNYIIKLMDNWQPLYNPIYSLGFMKLETLKIYIKNNLTNGFIKLFKSLIRALIIFNKKSDRSLKLCVNYQSFNNLIIKNWYLLSLVGELLDWLGWAWHFT